MSDLATRVTEAASGLLERRVGRRSLLSRAALAGSAVSVAPLRYLLRPVSAYAAICGCANQQCDCGQPCCDGYTEFCCTLSGQNTCPPGSVVAGWWKADGSGLCGPNAPRYYMDCNAAAGGPCGPSGVTATTGVCACGCAGANCDHRWSCCTAFRYGQCNQQISCVGPIICRVVTCTPPWYIEPTCTTTVATDNFTRTHDAPCLHQPTIPSVPGSLPLVISGSAWHRGFNRSARSDLALNPFYFGEPGDVPVVGDWDIDGVSGPGVFRRGQWFLRNRNSTGQADRTFVFGEPTDTPIVGDWVGDGRSLPGVVRGNQWFLKNNHDTGGADVTFSYGLPDDIPVVGDWDGDGVFSPGVFRGGTWYLRNSNSTGVADVSFTFGAPGDIPIVGDWNNDGKWGVGVIRNKANWFLRDTLSAGNPEASFVFDVPGVDYGNIQYRVWTSSGRTDV